MQYYLAVDIGASSGRHILGHVENGKMVLEEMYRFENGVVQKNGHLCWQTDALFNSIVEGLKACKVAGKCPSYMGIDTWGVDFVLLDEKDQVIGDTVAYRDSRTEGMDKEVEKTISLTDLYAKAGIQKQPFNTIYQLAAIKKDAPEMLDKACSMLMIPEYFNFLLTGIKRNEYTNATTGSLVNARSKQWDLELIDMLGFPRKLFGELRVPGTVLGGFTDAIKEQVGFDCQVILPATHDTGSAFLAVPAKDDNAVYISSGTWSLMGVENMEPITTEESLKLNLTNEGGYNYRYRYLKNIMGLWMIQSIRRNLDKKFSFADLEQMAREAADFDTIIDVDDACFLAPDNMIDAVKTYCVNNGLKVPETIGEVMQCVYISLADKYAATVRGLQEITGKTYTSINIVGGGSKDGYLNMLTSKATGLPVYAGPTEGTALGNLMVQMIVAGEYADLAEARKAIKVSFDIKEIQA